MLLRLTAAAAPPLPPDWLTSAAVGGPAVPPPSHVNHPRTPAPTSITHVTDLHATRGAHFLNSGATQDASVDSACRNELWEAVIGPSGGASPAASNQKEAEQTPELKLEFVQLVSLPLLCSHILSNQNLLSPQLLVAVSIQSNGNANQGC